MEWTGSPTKKVSAAFNIYDENTHSQVCAFTHSNPSRKSADHSRFLDRSEAHLERSPVATNDG